MDIIITILLTLLSELALIWWKPEKFLNWPLHIITKRLEKGTANLVTNTQGVVLIKTGVFFLRKIPDAPEIAEKVDIIDKANEEIRETLKKNGIL